MQRKVCFAQDSQSRHVGIKLVKSGSNEHNILRFIYEHGEEAAENCILPVIEIIEDEDNVFVVSPRYVRNWIWSDLTLMNRLRWGSVVTRPIESAFTGMKDLLDFIHSILKVSTS